MFAPKYETHAEPKMRIEEMENARFRLGHKEVENRTIADRDEEIRLETLHHFTNTFGQ